MSEEEIRLIKGYFNDGYCCDLDELKEIANKMIEQLQQKENIIKEVREFVEKWKYKDGDGSVYFDMNTNPNDLLRILDKGE